MFWTFGIYRHLYLHDFTLGTRQLDLFLGTVNTAVLLTSSWTMAMAVHTKTTLLRSRRLLLITSLLGILFLCIKGYEYYHHGREGMIPSFHWDNPNVSNSHFLLFFVLYFLMTGLHAFHLIIGIGLVLIARRQKSWLENVGLYWHFVDVVWIFLFPMLYLLGRTT